MLDTMTDNIVESLEQCTVASAPLNSIKLMKWPRALKDLTCLSDTILMTKFQLEELAKKKDPEGITKRAV